MRHILALVWMLCALAACKHYTGEDLLRAVEAGDEADVRKVLDKGISANSTDKRGYGGLYFAAYRGHKSIVELLLSKGADVNAAGDTGYTPLHAAAQGGHAEIAGLLIERGADINARSKYGITPLREARKPEVADLLRSHGAH